MKSLKIGYGQGCAWNGRGSVNVGSHAHYYYSACVITTIIRNVPDLPGELKCLIFLSTNVFESFIRSFCETVRIPEGWVIAVSGAPQSPPFAELDKLRHWDLVGLHLGPAFTLYQQRNL